MCMIGISLDNPFYLSLGQARAPTAGKSVHTRSCTKPSSTTKSNAQGNTTLKSMNKVDNAYGTLSMPK